jgi:hypothetical protein
MTLKLYTVVVTKFTENVLNANNECLGKIRSFLRAD